MSEQTRPESSAAEQRVRDYRLLTKIGEGGMGVVYLAQGPDGSRVALKVLRQHIIGDGEARQRLSREVASLRLVKSHRVAEVLDADPWGDTPYVATRYVPGLSLHQHVHEEGPIRGEDLRWFAAGLAEAVIDVHSVGVLHRDVKPSNVLLEGRAPVLIDFGLARLAEDPRLTASGWLLGTPGYVAPEILFGEDATPASDVHAWAATVVFAATGRPPYGRGPAMAIMDRVRRGEHDLSDVPGDIRPLLERCLAPDPADRPDTFTVLSSLRAPVAPESVASDDLPTMPYALASAAASDQDATEVLGSDDPTELVDTAAGAETARQGDSPPPTRPLTTALPQASPPPALEPAREPYMTPPPPQSAAGPPSSGVDPSAGSPRHGGATPPPAAWRPLPDGAAKVQRGSLLLGMFGLVAVGFATAPYLSLAALGLVTLAVRTLSWTTEAARERRWRRGGGPRWYDVPLTVASAPWYLVVATGGTLVLMVWSAALAVLVGLVYLLFGLPMSPGLLMMGAVVALSLWWGPGSRRLRVPTRRLVVLATRDSGTAWAAVGVLAVAVALCAYLLASGGVVWDPQPGPPWRPGTVLGGVAAQL